MTTTPERRTVALLGLFGVGNIGNEASLASARRAVDAAGHDSIVLCAVPEVVRDVHGVRAEPIGMSGPMPSFDHLPRPARIAMRPFVEMARFVAAFRFVRTVDAVVVPGTGILDDFGMTPWEMPWDLCRWAFVSRLARRPFSLLSIGAGPIEHPLSRRFARWTIRSAVHCTYRDEWSRKFVESIGVPAPPESVVPDVVLTLPRPDGTRAPDADLCVGLGVMAYWGWRNDPEKGADVLASYVSSMADIAIRLLERGHDIRVLVGEGTDERAVLQLVDDLRRRAPERSDRVHVGPIESIESLLAEIASTDAVICTRFHNVAASLMMHRPTVSIGYAEKNRELMESAGLGAFCHDIDRIDVDRVIADLIALLEDRDRIARDLAEWDARTTARVERQYDETFGSAPVGTIESDGAG